MRSCLSSHSWLLPPVLSSRIRSLAPLTRFTTVELVFLFSIQFDHEESDDEDDEAEEEEEEDSEDAEDAEDAEEKECEEEEEQDNKSSALFWFRLRRPFHCAAMRRAISASDSISAIAPAMPPSIPFDAVATLSGRRVLLSAMTFDGASRLPDLFVSEICFRRFTGIRRAFSEDVEEEAVAAPVAVAALSSGV